jgi:hypothetical protein
MTEDLLHFTWKFRLFDAAGLETTGGERVEIIQPGTHNRNAGADFQNARIKIGKVLWAGNVELHLKSSDWTRHKHQNDAAYDNVILHVVYENDKPVEKQNGQSISTLELKRRISAGTLSRYEELSKRQNGIPCAKHFKTVDEFTIKSYLDRLLVERLESKVEYVQSRLGENGNDWENLTFAMIARYFGASINKEPFYLIANSLPVKIWAKHCDDPLQIAALVFGQAGFLEEKADDEYPQQLRKEYLYLKRLHALKPVDKHLLKLLRLRPSNFPSIRLAQLAAFMCKDTKIFSKILEAKSVQAIHDYFDVEVHEYWKIHYHFDKPSKSVRSHLGNSTKNILLINAVAPVLFAYGRYKNEESYCERALHLLESCKAETNSIITGWKSLGLKPLNAYDTQALLQLKTAHCDKFDCLNCAIGLKILS